MDIGLIGITVLKWSVKLVVVLVAIFAFIVILNFALSMIFTSVNGNVLGDIFALVQMFLPFNLNVILFWITAGASAFILFKISLLAIVFINDILGD